MDVSVHHANPMHAASAALSRPGDWNPQAILVGVITIAIVIGGRRWSPRFPGALVASVLALGLSAPGLLTLTEVGRIPSGLPPLNLALPWRSFGDLVVPALVIALVGFAEPASIARRYAAQDRKSWDPNKEFIGQGLANLAAGAFGGHPAGGSFSRSALNRLSGARTRWSGVISGVTVLAIMPVASVLSQLPKAVLAGLVISATVSLLELRPFREAWRCSRPQFFVAVPTFVATIASAPRVERGVIVGLVLALAVHLWRELRLEVEVWTSGRVLHVRPQGVLYFGSAPSLETRVMSLVAEDPSVRSVVLHLDQVGRLDFTGALVLRSLIQDMRAAQTDVRIEGTQPQARRLVEAVLGQQATDTPPRDPEPTPTPIS